MQKSTIIHREISYSIIGAAFEVHKVLGPGFLESVYQRALAYEFDLCGIQYEQQKPLDVYYKDRLVGEYLADFVVCNEVILEIKAVSNLLPAHTAQAYNYLAATGMELAILINFGSASLQQKRIILTRNRNSELK